MSEVKDPAIKLFGKTIQLQPNEGILGVHHEQNYSTTTTSQNKKKPSGGKQPEPKHEDVSSHPISEELICQSTLSGISEDPKTPNADKETPSPKTTKNEDSSETTISEENTLKKPDKILPCPRCNSMETKFCYYNNYNVNQPRHFCKNCQRYWTAGGTMRNVPVGSGRRKNKSSSASQYRHIMVSEALQAARADVANGIHHSTLTTNGSVVTFGSDAPLCESMASALNLAEKSQNCVGDGFRGHEQIITVSCGGREIGDDHSSGSSTASNLTEKGGNGGLQESILMNFQGSTPQVPCFPGPCLWNSAQWSPPAVGPSGFPVSFYPSPYYWGCTVPGPWTMPWLSLPSSSSDHSTLSSGPNSPTLGKHSRDGNVLKPSNTSQEELSKEKGLERGVLIPRTLRISDPSEAAKSSIWSTLGIKNENAGSISGGSLFKAFQPKRNEKNHIAETSLALQANPAAFSRSLNFQESA